VIYPGSTPVGNATLVVANVLTCNKHSQKKCVHKVELQGARQAVAVVKKLLAEISGHRFAGSDQWLQMC
jgi:hypothetical protein